MFKPVAVMVLIVLTIATVVLPWTNRSTIKDLRKEVDRLKRRLGYLEAKNPEAFQAAEQEIEPETDFSDVPADFETFPVKPIPSVSLAHAIEEAEARAAFSDVNEEPSSTEFEQFDPVVEQKADGFEKQFGGKAFVWMGGVALALAGFYMVKYSIETGLLSPAVRVILGIIFGIAMLIGGGWIGVRPRFSDSPRISQALAGAGIADLYACLFAATSVYRLIPQPLGFAGMVAVTVTAVLVSLRQGPPIAILGMLGGFLTPAFVGSTSPSAPLLFLYLYAILAGMMVFIRKQGWWFLSIPAVVLAFAWVFGWMLSHGPQDGACLGLFLLAASATIVGVTRVGDKAPKEEVLPMPLKYVAFGGSLILMGMVTGKSNFEFMDWALFGLLSIGGIGLACKDEKQYSFLPWVSMAVNALMMIGWSNHSLSCAVTLMAFAALYMASGYVMVFRSSKPFPWASLAVSANGVYYFFGWGLFHQTPLVEGIPYLWSGLALAFAGLNVLMFTSVMSKIEDSHPEKQSILALFAAIATAFFSLALTIELEREFLSVAFACEMLALAWINTRLDVKALRSIIAVLACAFGVLLAPQLILIVQLVSYSMFEAKLRLQESVPIVTWPLFQLGVPALCFLGGSHLLRKQRDDAVVRGFEISAIALVGLMGYYLMRHAFHIGENILFVTAGFVERGAITNVLFAYGLACLWSGGKLGRKAVVSSGKVLSLVAIFRICWFDLMVHNPLWVTQAVGNIPIFNALLLTYGLPIAWIWKGRQLIRARDPVWDKILAGLSLVLAFVLVSFEARQWFHGEVLVGASGSAEIYTYSAVWLIFGIALLFLGTLRQEKEVRVASLLVMLLTVGKVFLYDASELTGLWRVFSFFGLGLSLLGLSWFYSRFVFPAKMPASQKVDAH